MMQVQYPNGVPVQNVQDKILPALAKVKAKLQGVAKSTNNPFFKSKYADLNAHLDAVEPLLEENGLMLLQPVTTMYSQSGIENVVTSRIYHIESGQSIESSMKLVGGSDMQKMGSGVTYARRYTLGSLLSMQALDDDGEGIADRGSKDKPEKAQSKVAPAKEPVKEAARIVTSTPAAPVAKEEPKKEEAKPARPSFRRPAKPAAAPQPQAAAPADEAGHGDDI